MEGGPAPPSDTASILQAIHVFRESLEGRIAEVHSEVTLLCQDLRKVSDRVTEAEHRISELEDTTQVTRKDVAGLVSSVAEVAWRVDDAENRARRNNLRFVGFPEKVKGGNPGQFLLTFLKDVLPQAPFSTGFIIERAHRMPSFAPPLGAPPRPLMRAF